MVYEIGTRVKVTGSGITPRKGRIGVVIRQDNSDLPNLVKFDLDGATLWFSDQELRELKEEKTVSVSVGDKVTHPYYNGELEVLFQYDHNKIRSVVRAPSGSEFTVGTDSLTIVPKPAERNPNAPDFALSMDDIKPGVKLRTVVNGVVGRSHTVVSVKNVHDFKKIFTKVEPTFYNVNGESAIYSGDSGLLPVENGDWSTTNYVIPDTTDAVLKVLQNG